MIYYKIYMCLEKYLETVPSVLHLPDTKEAESKIHLELSNCLDNKIHFEVQIIDLEDKQDENFVHAFGNFSLVLIEFQPEIEYNLKYFGVLFNTIESETFKGKPILHFFLSEILSDNKASFCQLFFYSRINKLNYDRYNIEMNNSEESFINTIIEYMEDLEFTSDVFTKIDENGVERKYQEGGIGHKLDRQKIETKEITES